MSRCYPYPPPGYVKKANVELALSAKKEKHKHKDKKKKRQKDNETNGDLPRDPDKRSKKSHQVGVVINEDRSLANGSLLETKVASSDALHKKTSQKLPAGSSNAEVLSAGVLARNGKGHEISSKQKHELPLVSLNAACETNGKNWSALDDQGWLFHQSDHWSGAVPRQKVDESNSSQVWAEAMLLPSVGIYALPYVVPD
ncbi:hypothetical protein GOP47_0000816 [Adiantum capillus-veneris]|uniref:Uncharacterized protein n=1 Tax=Adiantum capillus-veneris TaxID=13818 RepID=A0A9D4VE82_ADICA|nr:hypothetical protein GOP47_0000816 [Adiantum capillus-veneris]